MVNDSQRLEVCLRFHAYLMEHAQTLLAEQKYPFDHLSKILNKLYKDLYDLTLFSQDKLGFENVSFPAEYTPAKLVEEAATKEEDFGGYDEICVCDSFYCNICSARKEGEDFGVYGMCRCGQCQACLMEKYDDEEATRREE